MNKTKYIVPVSNFYIELAFKLGDFIYSPSFEFLQKGYEEVSTVVSISLCNLQGTCHVPFYLDQ